MDYHKNAPWTAVSRERLARMVISEGVITAHPFGCCPGTDTEARSCRFQRHQSLPHRRHPRSGRPAGRTFLSANTSRASPPTNLILDISPTSPRKE